MHSGATLGRRACAALAVCSAVLHGVMVGDAANLAVGVLIVGMALACLYCARELWAAGSPRVWCIVAVMNLGMVAVHWSMPGHHHGEAVTIGAASPMSTLMIVATAASLVEAVVATAVLWVITRRRAVSLTPQWN
ncbi:MAG: hypothetical protein ABW001_04095 [Mycobacterium sp.]